jgi:endoglucanase
MTLPKHSSTAPRWFLLGALTAVFAIILTSLPAFWPTAKIGLARAADNSAVPTFKRGINLSRLQSFAYRDPKRPGKYQWPPFKGDLSKISDKELDRLTSLGFDFVRLPVDAGPFLAATAPEQRLLVDDLKTIIVRLLEKNFNVMVDMHPANYLSVWQPKDILKEPNGPAFEAYSALLVTIAKRIRDLPPTQIAFELINEPQPVCWREDSEDWSVSQQRLFSSVREIAPNLPIVLTGGCWSSINGLDHLDPAPYDDKTLFDIHFYEPHYFTHQSLPWASLPLRYIAGFSYPWHRSDVKTTEELTRQHIANLVAGNSPLPENAYDSTRDAIRDYYQRKKPDLAFIESRFSKLADWANLHDVSPSRIIIGEFGVIRRQKGIPEDGSRLEWLRDVRKTIESLGFGWALWDYYEGFGLMTDNAKRTIEVGMVNALGLNAAAVPHDGRI